MAKHRELNPVDGAARGRQRRYAKQRRRLAEGGSGERWTEERLRHLTMKKFLRGWSVGVIAKRFGLPVETVQCWVRPPLPESTGPRLVRNK